MEHLASVATAIVNADVFKLGMFTFFVYVLGKMAPNLKLMFSNGGNGHGPDLSERITRLEEQFKAFEKTASEKLDELIEWKREKD